MSTWTLIQIVFDIFMATGLFVVVMRMNRAPKDDPRLSRGLQLLQSKIAVLEDLSDRTENQVNQLTAILEQKSREVQAKVQLAEQHVQQIKMSMERSLEVAQIFQDKIPHKEIIERQNTIKYVQAARLAHQGVSVEEIGQQVDLPKGELDFIASVNRERLMFDESELPAWANEPHTSAFAPESTVAPEPAESQEESATRVRAEMELAERQRLVENLSRLQFEMKNLDIELARENGQRDLSGAFDVPQVETASLKKLGEEFRKAVEEGEKSDAREQLIPLEQISSTISQVMNAAEQVATKTIHAASQAASAATKAAPIRLPEQTQETPRDPVLARVVAQQKVQAALRLGAQPKPATSVNPELEAARAMAKEATAPLAKTHIVRERKLSGQQSSNDNTVIKKVLFPRLDGEDLG